MATTTPTPNAQGYRGRGNNRRFHNRGRGFGNQMDAYQQFGQRQIPGRRNFPREDTTQD